MNYIYIDYEAVIILSSPEIHHLLSNISQFIDILRFFKKKHQNMKRNDQQELNLQTNF